MLRVKSISMRPDQVQAISVQAGALDVGEAMHFGQVSFTSFAPYKKINN